MRSRSVLAATAAALALLCGPASACTIVVQATIQFQPGSSDTANAQIADFSAWLGDARKRYLAIDVVLIEAFAPAHTAGAQRLARERMQKATRIVRTLTGGGLPIEARASVSTPTTPDAMQDNQAVVQLVPSGPLSQAGCPQPRP